jgi:outer membrane protein OmpA-like peptidoglycan-associated protein
MGASFGIVAVALLAPAKFDRAHSPARTPAEEMIDSSAALPESQAETTRPVITSQPPGSAPANSDTGSDRAKDLPVDELSLTDKADHLRHPSPSGVQRPQEERELADGRLPGDQVTISELQATIAQLKAQLRREDPQGERIENASSAPGQQAETILTIGDGLFRSGQFQPTAILESTVEKVVPLIQARPMDQIIIEGHTDTRSSNSDEPAKARRWNMRLSQLRAQAVANILQQKGVSSARISVQGYGATVPLAANTTKAGRAKNRRVEIKLIPAQR